MGSGPIEGVTIKGNNVLCMLCFSVIFLYSVHLRFVFMLAVMFIGLTIVNVLCKINIL